MKATSDHRVWAALVTFPDACERWRHVMTLIEQQSSEFDSPQMFSDQMTRCPGTWAWWHISFYLCLT